MTTIRQQVARLAGGQASSRSMLEQARERAQAAAELNAIAHVDWPQAAAAADALDARARAGNPVGPLHGVPVTVKDLFHVEGMPLQAGTRAKLPGIPREASVVARLRDAGALVFAKTNMHEIALGATGENPWTGDVKNPRDPRRQAGGSSSGSAVAVAVGIGAASVGSDTGGSVRIPAAFCGVVGFKPTFGAVPLDGALPLSWTCDHAGPLARCVADAALLYEVIAQRQVRHGAVARRPRLAIPAQWLRPRLSAAVRESFERVVASLRGDADVAEVDTPTLPLAWEAYTPIVRAEAAYVHRAALAAGGEGFSDAVSAPLRAGSELSAQRYLDAMSQREQVRSELDALLAGHDALILPTSAVAPPLRGQTDVDVAAGRMTVREAVLGQTLPFSLVGLPALSLPAGDADGLPMGLQVVGRRDRDASLLALCGWLESSLAGSALSR
ncbi:MAG TPA: amidase [Burkholderiaceae bacterium]|nr:amidase [Burkholderiaceae bacterium]